jgi:DNA gyrase subunit A
VLPLPEDEAEWGKLHVMFATAKGLVRRNSMDAFANIRTSGKIAMRFEEGSEDRLIGVSLLTGEDDVLLATRNGKAIRFAATDVREFQSRDSTGVRGARVIGDDEVISMSVLRGFAASPQDREDYLRAAPWKERREGLPEPEQRLSDERMGQFAAAEEFILTVCANGYGKRSSAYEYRRTNRGGQGITNIDNLARNGPVVASFPAHHGEQLMLVTDQAKMIRMSVGDTRVIGRNSAGVRLFNVAENEHVVSAARIEESAEEEAELGDGGGEIAPDDDAVIGEDLADGGEGEA